MSVCVCLCVCILKLERMMKSLGEEDDDNYNKSEQLPVSLFR